MPVMVSCCFQCSSVCPLTSVCPGRFTHCVFICFGLFTNILVTLMLVVGGAAVVTSLTGMPTEAACFLLPLGVVLYTMFGG